MMWTKKSILLILAALIIISGILPFTNLFASSYYEIPSYTAVENDDPQPVEKNLPPSTAATKKTGQTGGTLQQTGPMKEETGTTVPPAARQPDQNLHQPGQRAQEPSATPQFAQKRPQSYPSVHYPWFHQMNPDYQPDYEWYDDESHREDNWGKGRQYWE